MRLCCRCVTLRVILCACVCRERRLPHNPPRHIKPPTAHQSPPSSPLRVFTRLVSASGVFPSFPLLLLTRALARVLYVCVFVFVQCDQHSMSTSAVEVPLTSPLSGEAGADGGPLPPPLPPPVEPEFKDDGRHAARPEFLAKLLDSVPLVEVPPSPSSGSSPSGAAQSRRFAPPVPASAGAGAASTSRSDDPLVIMPPSLPSTFTCMRYAPVFYSWTNRSTHSDVLATTVTTRPAPSGGTRRLRAAGAGAGGGDMALRLPYAKAAPPISSSLSHSKRNRALIRERDEFMAALKAERDEREAMEAYAATEIQKTWKGFAVRLPALRERQRRRAAKQVTEESEAELRRELQRLKAATSAKLAAERDAEDDLPEWRRKQRERLAAKEAKRKRRMAQAAAVVRIQAVVRGVLARIGMRIIRQLCREERGLLAVVKLQAVVRGFLLRARLRAEVLRVRQVAAQSIQNAVRRALAARRINMLRDQMRDLLHRDNALVNIQKSWRGHLARRRALQYRRERAALPVQASWRGFLARRRAASMRFETEAAATRIQALQRSRLARKETLMRLQEAQLEKAAFARRKRLELARQREAEAAAEAARLAAEEEARRVREEERRAAEAAEAARREAELKEQEQAAVAIQSAARVRAARREVESMRQRRLEGLAAEAQEEEDRRQREEQARRDEERKRKEAEAAAAEEEERIRQETAARQMQRVARGRMDRRRVQDLRRKRLEDLEAEAMAAAPRRRVRRGASKASFASSADDG